MSEFTDYLPDIFALLGPISIRRMFGGHALYHQGLTFGLVFDETLYLKADAENAGDFQALALPRFGYEKQGRWIDLPYYQAPDFILEDRDLAASWARKAYAAALRTKPLKPRRSSKRTSKVSLG
ncbi:TfoX/Sxy family protein [Methylovorus sp. MP688]|uniref:TfoX/Sxy family protein n=1 Tax=Methylovorus sp. (strain MP688) TaxID=887061 RepID=UPI0001EC435C|nr:TfoX/Sxy family protein [Methylovorus sp. MP688]ADQ83391.1 TfoX domain protein [Methylovorus sp. MP688]